MSRSMQGQRMLAVLGIICALVIGLAGPAKAAPGPSVKLKITLDMNECALMYVGTVGSCIISLQTWMNWAVGTKQTRIPINGVYTEQTRVLVATFQRKYVRGIVPNGKFGDRSRAALRDWFVRGATRSGSSGVPCNTALGWGAGKTTSRPISWIDAPSSVPPQGNVSRRPHRPGCRSAGPSPWRIR